MIHNAWTEARGDSNAMKKVAEDLEKITQPSVNIYVSKTGLSEEKVKEMMDREEWITSKEAYELGFSTTQVKKDNTKQSLEADYVFNLVMKNKEMQTRIEELTKEKAENLLNKDLDKEPEQNQIKGDSWESFFNTKN